MTGVPQVGRLTNLTQLTVDTSWWTRYRSDSKNPDFGDSFDQAVPTLNVGRHTAIPRTNKDLVPDSSRSSGVSEHTQAIANTAGFHFGTIEQGGSSLYPSLAQRAIPFESSRDLSSGHVFAIRLPPDCNKIFSSCTTRTNAGPRHGAVGVLF